MCIRDRIRGATRGHGTDSLSSSCLGRRGQNQSVTIPTATGPLLLDCESADSAFASLELILGISRSAIETTLDAFDLNEVYERNSSRMERDEYVYRRVVGDRKVRPEQSVATCWFHLTRVLPPVDFGEGILPLHDRVDAIWEQLFRLQKRVDAAEWSRYRQDMGDSDSAYAYCLKALGRRELHGGPFAVLVRETAFHAKEMHNHDYLRWPEIVEDITRAFQKRYGYDLPAAYRSAAHPCIVKFRDAAFTTQHLYTTLAYLYERRHGHEFFRANYCFNGKGLPITGDRILRIEFNPTP